MSGIKFNTRADKIFYKLDRENKLNDQNGRCHYCNSKLSKLEATFDHVIPLSSIGRMHSSSNTVVACEECNQSKGSTPVEEFEIDRFRKKLHDVLASIEERTRLAVFNLDMNPKGGGSYNKWKRYWQKRGKLR